MVYVHPLAAEIFCRAGLAQLPPLTLRKFGFDGLGYSINTFARLLVRVDCAHSFGDVYGSTGIPDGYIACTGRRLNPSERIASIDGNFFGLDAVPNLEVVKHYVG